jgi:nucleoside-diphosphate kinase
MAVEQTFFMVKPGGVKRGLSGEIIRRVEARGLRLVGLKLMVVSTELAEQHYDEHRDKPFFGELIEGITAGPVVAMVVEGESSVRAIRAMTGATNPIDALPGTIRGDLALEMGENVVHSSADPEAASREVGLWFTAAELGLATA